MKKADLAECARKSEIEELSALMKAACDANRLKIVCFLFEGEKCVCEIERKLLISQPLVSHHLHVLREAGLVDVRREGTWAYYSLNRTAVEKFDSLFRQVLGADRFPEGYPERKPCGEAAGKASLRA